MTDEPERRAGGSAGARSSASGSAAERRAHTGHDGGESTPVRRTAAGRAAMERAERRREKRSGRSPGSAGRGRVRDDSGSTGVREGRVRDDSGSTGRVRRDRQVTRRSGPPTRRRALLRRWVAVVVALCLTGLTMALLYTPLLGVRSVDVSGVHGLTPDQVRTAAAVAEGSPMLTLDTDAIGQRVSGLTQVASVDVFREWPATLRIDVTERTPVGVLPERDGVHLVDGTGLDFKTVSVAPPGLPRIDLPGAAPSGPRTQAVVQVLAALPSQLRTVLVSVSAQTPASVQLGLADGRTVRWGSSADSARKAAVLAALMTRPGKIYDVSSPDLPTVS